MAQRLGQHFLKDKSALEKIVNALDIKDGDFIIEIGAGHGELTNELRIKNKELRIIAIEKDQKFAGLLKEKFAGDKNTEIIQGDALKVLPQITKPYVLNPRRYKIVGNLPYYITGYLFRTLANLEPKPETMVFTIQKEVGERIIAKNGMNLLAASIQFWARPEIIDFISKTAFRPQPKVNSAIIKLTTNNKGWTMDDKQYEVNYYKFIKILFKQPRKTILNNLSAGFEKSKSKIEETLKKNEINPDDRPQNLTISQIIILSTITTNSALF